MGSGTSIRPLRTSRKERRRQQVAAVCYRIGRRGIEFLLVQTRGGRWIFPKGGVEPGLTHAQSAALEAFEEAGVHGRIEEIPFARYMRSAPEMASSEPAVAAYLCEVTRREATQEANRNPTWLSLEKAKQRLLRDRPAEFGSELARVLERAKTRIERLRRDSHGPAAHQVVDELRKVRFDYFEAARFQGGAHEVAPLRHCLGQHVTTAIGTPEMGRRILRLGAGGNSSSEPARNVTAIDTVLGSSPSKLRNTPPAKPRACTDK